MYIYILKYITKIDVFKIRIIVDYTIFRLYNLIGWVIIVIIMIY